MTNTDKVLQAWHNDRPEPKLAIWTDGRNIWSYDTCLLAMAENGQRVLNATKYSTTTSKHQNRIDDEITALVTVSDLDRGARPADLIRKAREDGLIA